MHLEVHQKIQQRWLAELTGSSPDPAYNPPTLDQVKRADVELWRLLAERTELAGIRPGSDGKWPLDELVPALLDHPRIAMILTPLPKAAAPRGGGA